MHDSENRSRGFSPDFRPRQKRLGGYLVEAGLLTPAQIDVALNDQKMTGMRFGEILAARGWVKQQTIEYLMEKVVVPEQHPPQQPTASFQTSLESPAPTSTNGSTVGKIPALCPRDRVTTKPLPSASSSDGDVSWVG